MIADLKTEKLYLFPNISLLQSSSVVPYSEGLMACCIFITHDYELYRLNPQNFTWESVLPEGQNVEAVWSIRMVLSITSMKLQIQASQWKHCPIRRYSAFYYHRWQFLRL